MMRPGKWLCGLLCFLVLLAACAPDAAAPLQTSLSPAATADAAEEQASPSSGGSSAVAYSPQRLREDFRILRTTLEEAHPGLYTYAGRAERDAQFDALEAQLDREMTGIEFYRLIAPLVTGIHDGHTAVWPPADSPVYARLH